jgi:hypothetical protein
MKVYVAFTHEDLDHFSSLSNEDDLVLASTDIWEPGYIDIGEISFQAESFLNETRELFQKVSAISGVDITGFANNFFECSLRLSLFYIKALENAFDKYYVTHVVFSKKLSLFYGKPNYYLAEHESQGRLLYNRRAAIQPGVLHFVESHNAQVEYSGTTITLPFIRNVVRDIGVFSLKFIKSIKQRRSLKNDISLTLSTNAIVVVRSAVQLEFIKPLVENSSSSITLYVGHVFMGRRLFEEARKWSLNVDNVNVKELCSARMIDIIYHYLNSAKQYFLLKNIVYRVGEVEINVTQALREILIMSADTELYKSQLERTVLPCSNDFGVFFSCEQKSPHAYIDSYVAKQKGYQCAHLMTCDQESNDIPFPVFGDYFVVDTLKRLKLFQTNWSSNTGKLIYAGSIKSIGNDKVPNSEQTKYTYCYFAHANEVEHNVSVIKFLEVQCENRENINFCIKLHPRDQGKWLESVALKNGVLIAHGELSNVDLIRQFDVAISNPSAVVMDLLCQSKTFIFLDILKSYKNVEYVYIDEHYRGVARDFIEFESCLDKQFILKDEVLSLKERIFGEVPLLPSIDSLISQVRK